MMVWQKVRTSAHPQIPIYQSMTLGGALSGVRSEMVDFGPRQGRTRVFATGVARLRRGRKPAENAASGQNMPFVDGHELDGVCFRQGHVVFLGRP